MASINNNREEFGKISDLINKETSAPENNETSAPVNRPTSPAGALPPLSSPQENPLYATAGKQQNRAALNHPGIGEFLNQAGASNSTAQKRKLMSEDVGPSSNTASTSTTTN